MKTYTAIKAEEALLNLASGKAKMCDEGCPKARLERIVRMSKEETNDKRKLVKSWTTKQACGDG